MIIEGEDGRSERGRGRITLEGERIRAGQGLNADLSDVTERIHGDDLVVRPPKGQAGVTEREEGGIEEH